MFGLSQHSYKGHRVFCQKGDSLPESRFPIRHGICKVKSKQNIKPPSWQIVEKYEWEMLSAHGVPWWLLLIARINYRLNFSLVYRESS